MATRPTVWSSARPRRAGLHVGARSRFEMWWCFGCPTKHRGDVRLVFDGIYERHRTIDVHASSGRGMIRSSTAHRPSHGGLGSRTIDETTPRCCLAEAGPHPTKFKEFLCRYRDVRRTYGCLRYQLLRPERVVLRPRAALPQFRAHQALDGSISMRQSIRNHGRQCRAAVEHELTEGKAGVFKRSVKLRWYLVLIFRGLHLSTACLHRASHHAVLAHAGDRMLRTTTKVRQPSFYQAWRRRRRTRRQGRGLDDLRLPASTTGWHRRPRRFTDENGAGAGRGAMASRTFEHDAAGRLRSASNFGLRREGAVRHRRRLPQLGLLGWRESAPIGPYAAYG